MLQQPPFHRAAGLRAGIRGRDWPDRPGHIRSRRGAAYRRLCGVQRFQCPRLADARNARPTGPGQEQGFRHGERHRAYLVTADEVGDPQSLAMSARVNGELWSQGSSAEMHFSFAEIVAYISQDETLYPGDLIGSGTVPSGCGLELDRWIQPGDTIELTVERLGTLRNRVIRREPSLKNTCSRGNRHRAAAR
ncbi:MAG: fumarylacetoacetate hydrolase family protein [Pirellulaceae bacterium]